MHITIYSKSNTLVFAGNAEVKGKFRGMGEETFTVSFVSTESLALDYGCYMDIDGARYGIHINPKKEDVGTHNVYSVVFESQKYELAGAQMQSFGRAKYDITTDLEGWVKLWMENANRVGSGWSYIINEPVKTLKTLLVDGETCLSAVNRIFSEFGKEFKFVGKQLVVGRIGVDLSTVLKVGRYNGLYSVTEDQKGTSNPITRMYVSGSDKNLPVDYCNANGATPTDRLNIKAVNGGLPYLENAADIAKYGIIEGNYSNEDIFPHRTGVVSSVDGADYQNLFDTSLDFDINAQMLPGVPANVTFITGDLSGYTFDVISYDAAAKKIRIAVGNDGSGKELPNAVLKPKTGDKYVLTSIAMPQSYITTAENDLKADAQVEFEKRRGFQGIFSANSIDPIFQQDQNFYPSIGDRVGIESNGVVKQVRIVEYSINKTSGVTIYEGIQFADTIEPTNLQKDANSQQKTNTDIYIANKGAKDANNKIGAANEVINNEVLKSLSRDSDGYIREGGRKLKVGFADHAANADHAKAADHATYSEDSNLWDGSNKADLIDQPVRTTDEVVYKAVKAAKFTSTNYVGGGFGGAGSKIDGNGAEFDNLIVRKSMIVMELIVEKISAVIGKTVQTCASGKVVSVEELSDRFRLYLETDGGTIPITFQTGDQVRCQRFDGKNVAYYWRLCTTIGAGYIDLSKTDADTNSGTPSAGDDIVTMGCRTAGKRQNFILSDGPGLTIDLYKGCCTYSLGPYFHGRFGDLTEKGISDLGIIVNAGRFSNVVIGGGSSGLENLQEWAGKQMAINNAVSAATTALQSANAANASVGNLDTEIRGAFKDGVISEAEAKAIASNYNVITDGFKNLEAAYNQVFVNQYLDGTPKSDLLNAKINLVNAKDALLNSISYAIADGKTTVAEKADVDSKFAAYTSASVAFTSAIGAANKAVQVKIDAIGKGRVDNLQIGGVNLLNDSLIRTILPNGSDYNFISLPPLSKSSRFVFSATCEVVSGAANYYTIRIYNLNTGVDWMSTNIPIGGRESYKFTTPPYEGFGVLLYAGLFGATSGVSLRFTKLQITRGDIDFDYDESPEDRQAQIKSTDYLKQALKAYSGADGGLLFAAMMRMGIFDEQGNGVTQAGISGVGTDPLSPLIWGGGDIAAAMRLVSEAINGVPVTGEKASSVITRDGSLIAMRGYLAAFKIIGQLLTCGNLKIGMIDGVAQISVDDSTNFNRTAVKIGDFALSDPNSLVGSGAVDVTPAYVYVSTSAPSATYWLTPTGVSATKTVLSTGVSAQTAYQLIFNMIASNSVGNNRTSLGILESDNYSSVDCVFTVTAYDSSNNILASNNVTLIGSSESTYEQYLLDKFVSLGFMTILSGPVFVEIKISQSASRYGYNSKESYSIDSITNVAVKLNTKIQLTSGKGIIEIGRGAQALYGKHKYFRMEDKVDTPLIRAEGDFEFNGCLTQDLLVGLYCSGTPGYNLGITRWQAHSVYTSSNAFTIAIQSTGHYLVTHGLQTRGVIANIYEYRPVVTAYPYTTWIDPSTITGDSFVVTVVDVATYQNPNTMFIQLWSMKGWKSS